jgi:hypothetical protein
MEHGISSSWSEETIGNCIRQRSGKTLYVKPF